MAENKAATESRPKPASGGLPTAAKMLLVAGGEEAGSVDTAVPAVCVRAWEVEKDDPRGWRAGEYRADIVVFNDRGAGAQPYSGVLVLGNDTEAAKHLETGRQLAGRDPANVTPVNRSVVAFWPSRS